MASVDKNTFENRSRPLDRLETLMHQVHTEFDGLWMFGNIQIFCSKEVIYVQTMEKAVQLATLRNPLLGSKVVKNDQDAYMFTPVTSEEIEFDVYDSDDWEGLLDTNIYELFQETSAQIRAVFLPKIQWNYNDDNSGFEEYQHTCGLFVAFSHAFCDDNSAARFTGNILTYLDEILMNKEFTLANVKILPSVSQFLQSKLQLTFMERITAAFWNYRTIRKWILKIFPKPNEYITKFGSELQRNPGMEPNSRFVPIEIGPRELDAVIRKCKENGTTVNGAVQASYLLAFASVMTDSGFEVPVTISHVDLMDFRRWYLPENKIPADYSMNAVGSIMFSTTVEPVTSERQFWEMARNMKKQTHAMIQGGGPLFVFKLLPRLGLGLINDIMECDPADATKRTEQCIRTSNVGKCDFLNRESTSSVKMRAKFGYIGGKKQGVIFQNYIYTFEGRLFWSVTYEKHVVKPHHAELYVRLVRNWFVKQSPE